jgi:hypothetical protein
MDTAVVMKKRKPLGVGSHGTLVVFWGVGYVLGQKLASGKIIVNEIKECNKNGRRNGTKVIW